MKGFSTCRMIVSKITSMTLSVSYLLSDMPIAINSRGRTTTAMIATFPLLTDTNKVEDWADEYIRNGRTHISRFGDKTPWQSPVSRLQNPVRVERGTF